MLRGFSCFLSSVLPLLQCPAALLPQKPLLKQLPTPEFWVCMCRSGAPIGWQEQHHGILYPNELQQSHAPKKSLQQDSAPSYRVKFRSPQEKKRIHSGKLFSHIHNLFSVRQGDSHSCTKGWQRLKHQFVPTETLLQDCTKDMTILFWLSAEVLTLTDIKMWKENFRQMESFSLQRKKIVI